MSNERERLARQWAQEYVKWWPEEEASPKLYAAAEHILATTEPETMAGVEWDDEKHYLAGAIDADGHEVVMLGTVVGTIRVCDVDEVNEKFAPVLEYPKTLTPNGKRYKLVESRPAEYWVETNRGCGWEPVDEDGMCREDYMEWKPWKWYALEGEHLTLERAVEAVRMGMGYKRPYRIMRGEDVVLEIPALPEEGGTE